ncbi:hypothetical protein KF840_16640 [bacterium]|nr:hypothetical protein [bacterium]
MDTRSGFTAALFLATILLATSGGRAGAQCVGDCNGDGQVAINELIIGVNIALGEQPVSACPAFANGQGEVTIAQLILGVNNALNGCPELPTPTATPSATPTETPEAGNCTLGGDSSLQLYFGAADNPIALTLTGSINVDCDVPENAASGECACTVGTIEPISIPAIGFVCVAPRSEPCPSAVVECDGGAPLGLELRSSGNIGSCGGNDACAAECATACAPRVASLSGCTGYCSLTDDVSCSNDADCLPDKGACNGPDPVGANFDICQCSCLDPAAGAAGRPGEMQCNLGAALTVERAAPCDGTDITINLGSACVPLTTATASTLITTANFNASATVPKNGTPASSSGAPVTCSALSSRDLAGLKARGAINLFGSALGDLAVLLGADCQ